MKSIGALRESAAANIRPMSDVLVRIPRTLGFS
jgi:hypothetical protein